MWNKVKVSGTARKAANRDFIEIRTADIFLENPIKHIKKVLETHCRCGANKLLIFFIFLNKFHVWRFKFDS